MRGALVAALTLVGLLAFAAASPVPPYQSQLNGCSIIDATGALYDVAGPCPTPTPGPTSYPNAGWVPYTTKNPFTDTVQAIYGSNPFSGTCPTADTYGVGSGTGCLMAKSAAVVSALSSGNGNTLMNFDLRLGNTSQLTAVFLNQNGTYGSLADADDDYPFFMDYPGETGLIATQVMNGGCNYNLEGNLQPQPQALNVPPGTVPQLTTDRKMDVRDSSSGKDFTFEGAGLITAGNVAANAGYFPIGFTDAGGQCASATYSNGAVENSSGSTPLGSDEVSYATALGLDDHASAGGMSQLWDIRAEDVLAGNPVHALIMNGGCDTNGANNILYPAYGNDFGGYCNNSSNNIDYGGHIVVDRQPAANLRGTDGCDIFSWFVLDTGYLYGFYMNDIGGVVQHPYLGLHMDSDISDTYSGNPYPPSGASPLTQVLTDMHNEWPEAYPSPSQNTRIGWGIPVTACGFTWNDFKYVIPPNKANYPGSP